MRPYLEEAFNSVLKQTYQNLEIIIVDDGSADGSDVVCDTFAAGDNRIHVIHQQNQGLSAARNIGLDTANGEMIAFLDSDDAYDTTFIENLLHVMIQEDTDLVECRYTNHITTGLLQLNNKTSLLPLIPSGKHSRVDALRALADGTYGVVVWNKLYKRHLWQSIRFPVGHVYEDLDTSFRILDLVQTIYVIDHPLYMHRVRRSSITKTKSASNLADKMRARTHLMAFIDRNTPDVFSYEQLQRSRRACVNDMVFAYLHSSCNKNSDGPKFSNSLRNSLSEARRANLRPLGVVAQILFHIEILHPRMLHYMYKAYRLFHMSTWE